MNSNLNQKIQRTECYCAIKQGDEWYDASYHDNKWHCDVPIQYDNFVIFDYTDIDEEDDDEETPPYDEWQPLQEWILTQKDDPISVADAFPLF